jgi:DNA-binding XRE family transcriptional regulator|tara:strand:+ start:1236 stop:1508 length:273 start_codon:yes stop_codon:yes gene_type:complete
MRKMYSCKKNLSAYNCNLEEITMTGNQLKKLRAKHNKSQTDVAKFLGYEVNGKPNRSMIARFENGYAKINPRISMLLEGFFGNNAHGGTK